MRTVAEVFIEERKKRGLSLEEVQRQTKIRKSILELLEKGDYDELPAPTFIKGLIRNYGEYLGLDVNELLALFRREYDDRKNVKTSPTPLESQRFVLTPRVVLVGFVSLVVILFVGYLYREYQSFAASPLLVIDEPQDNLKLNKTSVSVVGRSDPDAEVKINGQVINLGPGGTFTQEVGIAQGTNILVITAVNKLGKITTASRAVSVELPKEEPTPHPSASGSSDTSR